MQLADFYLFDTATFGGFHISKMNNMYGTSYKTWRHKFTLVSTFKMFGLTVLWEVL